MKKSMKGEGALTACQIQATRLNHREYRRLQQNINLMQDDLKLHLTRLQRQAQNIRYHYANVVRFVKPNPGYELWKELHAYEIARDENEIWQESMKVKQKPKTEIHRPAPASNEASLRPLLVLLGDDIQKLVEPVIDLGENFLQSSSSPVKNHLPGPHRKNTLWTMFHKRSTHSGRTVRPNPSIRDTTSFLPSVARPSSQKVGRSRSALSATPATSNLKTLYRTVSQNQTAYESVGQSHNEKHQLLDREFATQHRALKGIIRLPGLVK